MPDLTEDQKIKEWYAPYATKFGTNPDPFDPRHFYDFRAAYHSGATPNEEGHWPSQFKLEGHPRMVVGGVNTKTGQPVGGNMPDFLERIGGVWNRFFPEPLKTKTLGGLIKPKTTQTSSDVGIGFKTMPKPIQAAPSGATEMTPYNVPDSAVKTFVRGFNAGNVDVSKELGTASLSSPSMPKTTTGTPLAASSEWPSKQGFAGAPPIEPQEPELASAPGGEIQPPRAMQGASPFPTPTGFNVTPDKTTRIIAPEEKKGFFGDLLDKIKGANFDDKSKMAALAFGLGLMQKGGTYSPTPVSAAGAVGEVGLGAMQLWMNMDAQEKALAIKDRDFALALNKELRESAFQRGTLEEKKLTREQNAPHVAAQTAKTQAETQLVGKTAVHNALMAGPDGKLMVGTLMPSGQFVKTATPLHSETTQNEKGEEVTRLYDQAGNVIREMPGKPQRGILDANGKKYFYTTMPDGSIKMSKPIGASEAALGLEEKQKEWAIGIQNKEYDRMSQSTLNKMRVLLKTEKDMKKFNDAMTKGDDPLQVLQLMKDNLTGPQGQQIINEIYDIQDARTRNLQGHKGFQDMVMPKFMQPSLAAAPSGGIGSAPNVMGFGNVSNVKPPLSFE